MNKKEWKKPMVNKIETTEMHPTFAGVATQPTTTTTSAPSGSSW